MANLQGSEKNLKDRKCLANVFAVWVTVNTSEALVQMAQLHSADPLGLI